MGWHIEANHSCVVKLCVGHHRVHLQKAAVIRISEIKRVGSAPNTTSAHDYPLKVCLRQGLMHVAVETRVWFVTGGTKAGVMKLPGVPSPMKADEDTLDLGLVLRSDGGPVQFPFVIFPVVPTP